MYLLSTLFFSVWLALTTALPHHRGSLHIPLYKRSVLVRDDGRVDLATMRAHVTDAEYKYLRGVAAQQRANDEPQSSNSLARRAQPVALDPLTDEYNTKWYGIVSVGSPPVEFKLDFDTGSADMIIPASVCGSSCDGHTLYNPNRSSSSFDLHQNFSTTYGDGSEVSGEQYTDAVSLAGLVATNQTFGAASQYPTHLQIGASKSDGLLGMGFQGISVLRATPLVQTLITEKQITDSVFAFKLAETGSELSVGGFDSSLYKGSLAYTPVTQEGFWQISVDSMNVNGKAVNNNVSAIVDTGTTFILGDAEIVRQFYSSINATNIGNGCYSMPCNAMPNVSITIGGGTFTISPERFNLGSLDSSNDSCVGAVVGSGNLGDTWILGDVFLRGVFTVFDVGNLKVGFADLK